MTTNKHVADRKQRCHCGVKVFGRISSILPYAKGDAMTGTAIAKLLDDFEHGKVMRRQLIQSLALSATTTVAAGTVMAVPRLLLLGC